MEEALPLRNRFRGTSQQHRIQENIAAPLCNPKLALLEDVTIDLMMAVHMAFHGLNSLTDDTKPWIVKV